MQFLKGINGVKQYRNTSCEHKIQVVIQAVNIKI